MTSRRQTPAPWRWRPALPASDRQALVVWAAFRLAAAAVAAAGAALVGTGNRGLVVGIWRRWDADLLRKVAEFGYTGYPDRYPDRGVEAFFPGFPLVLRAVHAVVPDWTAAGLLVSLAAGAVASVALARLAQRDGAGGPAAVIALVVSPMAVFLAAGYTETLFLALAVPAWLAARSQRWAAAGLLAAGATAVRVNGLFLAAAILVLHLVAVRGRVRPSSAWLAAPLAVALGYAGYLRGLTGDWLRWQHAQEEGWGRRLTPPWDALATTWSMVTGGLGGSYRRVALLEILAVAVGVGLTAILLRRRRWGEATYVGLTVASLATSTFYLSVARSTLLWFPLWTAIAAAPAWLRRTYIVAALPLCVVGVLDFTAGRWAG